MLENMFHVLDSILDIRILSVAIERGTLKPVEGALSFPRLNIIQFYLQQGQVTADVRLHTKCGICLNFLQQSLSDEY